VFNLSTHWSRYCTTASSPTAIVLKPSGCCRVLQLAADAGLFYIYAHESTRTCHMDASLQHECRRATHLGKHLGSGGGRAMCIDEAAGRIFLYGGWDGERSLYDFWVYSIAEGPVPHASGAAE
jgi:hypothetical protein